MPKLPRSSRRCEPSARSITMSLPTYRIGSPRFVRRATPPTAVTFADVPADDLRAAVEHLAGGLGCAGWRPSGCSFDASNSEAVVFRRRHRGIARGPVSADCAVSRHGPTAGTEHVTAGPQSPVRGRSRRRRWATWGAVGLVVAFGLAQLVPYGHAKNPPVTKAAAWPNPQAQRLAESACYDCHSNLTNRWWATKIAPASWLAQSDIDGGRNVLNFSEWDKRQAALDDVLETVQEGSMPPIQYKLVHSDARLSDGERHQLVEGLKQLYATDPPAGTKVGDD